MQAIDYEPATTKIVRPSLSRRKQLGATTIGLCTAIWFMLLSGWLGITPGSVMTKRRNVLFNTSEF